jgi:hypothetical protein
MASFKDLTLIFIHLPKTGGTTLSHIMVPHFPEDQIFHIRNPEQKRAPIYSKHRGTIEDFIGLPESDRTRFRLILGHMEFGLHEHILRPSRYLTILREPVSRVLSQHGQHNRMITKNELDGKPLTLDEFLREKPAVLNNHQSKYLLGKLFKKLNADEKTGRLKERLEKYFVLVGTLERFDETVVLLNLIMGWKSRAYKKKNVGDPELQIGQNQALIHHIREVNGLDSTIHSYANDLLDSRILAFGKKFHKELKRFKNQNSRSNRTILFDSIEHHLSSLVRKVRG